MAYEFFIHLLGQVFALVSLIVAACLSCENYSNLSTHKSTFNLAIQNWALNPILDLKLGPRGICPPNYEPFFVYSFSGTSDGFYCQMDYDVYFLMKSQDSCDYTYHVESGASGINVNGLPSQTVNITGKDSNGIGQTICALRYRGTRDSYW
jgi:hypothetical protein